MAYDPKAGIWLSRDPSGESGGLNLYEAFNDDPINWDDPDGLAPTPVQQQAIANLASKYGPSWSFFETPTGYVGTQTGSGRQMIFNTQLDQTGYYSPLSRSWRLEARPDGSLWKLEKTWNADTQAWDPSSTQLVPSYQEAQIAQHIATEDARFPAFGLSDQFAAANGQNAATLISIRDHMVGAMKLGLQVVGAANPLVAGSEIVTGTTIDGQPMHGTDYMEAGASLIPAEIAFAFGGKVIKIATGVRARTLLREALGANPYPVAAQAHHLFPVELFSTEMGRKLAELGIDLNGAENGVLLPVKDYSGRVAALHSGRTSGEYVRAITRRFQQANPQTKDEALAFLNEIRNDLRAGDLRINNAK